jgi:hypothetical protein
MRTCPPSLFVDGREVMQAGHPERPVVASFDLPPGRHVLAIQAPRQRYPDWVQLAIRGRDWFAGTDRHLEIRLQPDGELDGAGV